VARRSVDIRDVAALAGVSVGSVSNVLNHPDRVSPDMRRRVQEAVTALGFVRNAAARNLRSGSSRTLGLVVYDLANPFFADVAAGAEEVALDAGYGVLLVNSGTSPERERRQLQLLTEQHVDGILLSPVDHSTRDEVDRLRERGTAVVLLETALARHCSVTVDDTAGGQLAGEHLYGSGHRVVGFVSTPDRLRQCRERRAGLVLAATAAGLDPVRAVVDIEATTMSSAAGFDAVTALLGSAPTPDPRVAPDLGVTAVFCANDLLALGALRALLTAGRRVPEDVALVGYDDIEFAAQAAIPLTSVRQPSHQLGRSAAELVLAEVTAGSAHHHQQVQFSPSLVLRASSALAAPTRARPPRARRRG